MSYLDACVVSEVRAAARFAFGCNYAFVDDDLHQLTALAIRALRAGLTEGMHPDTLAEIEKRRAVDWADPSAPPQDRAIGDGEGDKWLMFG